MSEQRMPFRNSEGLRPLRKQLDGCSFFQPRLTVVMPEIIQHMDHRGDRLRKLKRLSCNLLACVSKPEFQKLNGLIVHGKRPVTKLRVITASQIQTAVSLRIGRRIENLAHSELRGRQLAQALLQQPLYVIDVSRVQALEMVMNKWRMPILKFHTIGLECADRARTPRANFYPRANILNAESAGSCLACLASRLARSASDVGSIQRSVKSMSGYLSAMARRGF